MENKIDTKNLYVISLGRWKKDVQNGRSLVFKKECFTLAYKINNKKYIDAFTNSKYNTLEPDSCGNYKIQDTIYCHEPKPISQFFHYQLENKPLFESWDYIKIKEAKILLNDLNGQNTTNTIDKLENHTFNIMPKSEDTKKSFINDYNLVNKEFKTSPIVGRQKELENVIYTLATQNKNPILVGEPGVGKTAIIDMLAYKIKNDDVPNFLLNKNILEIPADEFISGTRYRGDLEKKFNDMINKIVKNNDILFIDEIHTLYGGVSTDNTLDMAALLKRRIDRDNLKVIGTTTKDEYDLYFSNDALKRRFHKIIIPEPDKFLLTEIVFKIFKDYSIKNNISINSLDTYMDDIVDILIKVTEPKNRDDFDYTYNPDLITLLLDLSFASAKINNQNELAIHNIITGLSMCDRIYETSRNLYIQKLENLIGINYEENCNSYEINTLRKRK